MTEEQVSRVLGNECVIFLTPAGFGETEPLALFIWTRTGVSVRYRYDAQADVFRVTRVSAPPLAIK